MCFAATGRTEKDRIVAFSEEAQRVKITNLRLVQRRLESKIKLFDGLNTW